MNTYHVRVAVDSVHGYQTFAVEAQSEKEAIAKCRTEGGAYVEQELDVMDLDWSDSSAELQDDASTEAK